MSKMKLWLSRTGALVVLAPFVTGTWAADRIWINQGIDQGTVHSLGNGKMLVYETGPNISTMYGGPFTSPSLYSLTVEDGKSLEVSSTRERGTAIWSHELLRDGMEIGSMRDFVDAELPIMVRSLSLTDTLRFRLELLPGAFVHLKSGREGGILQFRLDPGVTIYQYYVYPKPLYHSIHWEGDVLIHPSTEKEGVYFMDVAPGKADLFFTSGPEYDELITHRRIVEEKGVTALLERTQAWWKEFTVKRINFEEKLPEKLPQRNLLLRTIDDVAVMMRTQQAKEGAVIAGYPYPLGYVRDQYGVARGYLAMGYHEEAREILRFYWDIWKKTGKLHCAQGIGVDGIFHIHENDEVESPGYLILQAFDLLNKTEDGDFIKEIFPMLEWCWEVQKKHLAGYMLPFNGDETYVAGGILPRSTLNDGSSEATMLFIDGGELLLNWIASEKLWDGSKLDKEKKLLAATRDHFQDNFWKEGQLITNNPDRLNYTEAPKFRHGVCERGGANCFIYRKTGFGGIDWTVRDDNGRYQCMGCLPEGSLPSAEKNIYKLISVSLTPLYFHSELISANELKAVVDGIYRSFQDTGVLSSRTDVKEGNERSVGYDYGLVLYGMLHTGARGQEEIYVKTLDIVDEIGAWSEYYMGTTPSGTRCRPWESAINLEALIEFANQYVNP